ncbi:MAG: RNA polymerase-associated protein RapA [Chlamydiales bacterium]|nr:RNA polymerase-associated protein RapA [Chlamydiales bacterium]
MLNFRKLRQDFSSNILKEGKELFDKEAVMGAKILHLDVSAIRLSSRVKGAFENIYESEIEIDRNESMAIDSNCDCTYTYDCQHIAALLYFLENNLNEIVVDYSKETDLDTADEIDDDEKEQLRETFEKAATKEDVRKDKQYQKEVLREYVSAAKQLSRSPFFLPQEVLDEDQAELAVIFGNQAFETGNTVEVQLAIRLPSRSKPLFIPHVKAFLDAIRYREPLSISGRRYFFTPFSFSDVDREILTMMLHHARFALVSEERQARLALLDHQVLGSILARAYDLVVSKGLQTDKEVPLPCLYQGTLEEPLCFSTCPAQIKCALEYLEAPGPMLLIKPSFKIDEECITPEEAVLFESAKPGLVYQNTYYRFQPHIKRMHLQAIQHFHEITVPEPLFGTFIENALPVLRQYAEVSNPSLIERFVTLPYVEKLKGRCVIHYLNGELEAELFFVYDNVEIPAALSKLDYEKITLFVADEGILARNLVEERNIIDAIFEDFLFDEKEGLYRVKSEKKIVEFMTDVIPRTQDFITYECPENLSEQFIYDESSFELNFSESKRIDAYSVEIKVDGYLSGVNIDLLWDCIASKKRFLEMQTPGTQKGGRKTSKIPRILVLDLERTAALVQIFDEIGLTTLDNHTEERPLWSLTSIHPDQFTSLPVHFSMSKRLQQIQKQILGETTFTPQKVPGTVQATLRNYQLEGVHWLERLRRMHLNGVLADDMGLGKTLQAIIAITQSKQEKPSAQSLIVCPTSLVYNWQEEFHKFNSELKILVVDNVPTQRKKLLKTVDQYDVVITSYNLLQKDIEIYKEILFDYVVLDEAQHIKNRGTRNAKSVKMIKAAHKLVLTGTPIENSLEELWSLFDFLMPGLLSSFDRFVEKYIRNCGHTENKSTNLESLRNKISPFILRRMKADVLEDLPPVTEILYHCSLTDVQQELYTSYAKSAKEELSRLVKKEGFDKIQIHVLATLTRLKQICCHPAIFAKENPEAGDSAKYDMLMELLPSLIEGKHKTVIFSQYTKMLTILREDLKQRGIPFAYLDGSSKNRLGIVKQFNEDDAIPVFLVSLKAGGSGLNLVGADTVIHYDMWWNPAVENQATDRVHRMGQKKSVSSYKLVTLNTIEEKILNLQNRKKGLVKKVMSSDDEAIAKLTWEEVLELLQT